jgi:hypothetical protein
MVVLASNAAERGRQTSSRRRPTDGVYFALSVEKRF